ncbi:hypothetical protein [Catenuloplanes japonicus]|uniref:hypothetical protein n=1 Tax=Catenuloplanes japonicus TaxID=33876 RepID=UPI000527B3F3|nr:hypothetical protein [Catenuloplanes japonicus]
MAFAAAQLVTTRAEMSRPEIKAFGIFTVTLAVIGRAWAVIELRGLPTHPATVTLAALYCTAIVATTVYLVLAVKPTTRTRVGFLADAERTEEEIAHRDITLTHDLRMLHSEITAERLLLTRALRTKFGYDTWALCTLAAAVVFGISALAVSTNTGW